MTKEKLYKIYTAIIRGSSLTEERLNKYGITRQELEDLLKQKIIESIGKDEYKITDFNTLYNSGAALINNREYIQGISYLEICHEMNKEHPETKLRLILAYISTKQYRKIYELLDTLKDITISKKDYNLIIYLLSIITNYPEEYTEKVLNIEYKDIAISYEDKLYDKVEYHDTMRNHIMNNKFYHAHRIYLQELIHAFPDRVVSEIIERLLYQALEVNNKRTLIIIDYLKNKNYEGIVTFFNKKKQKTQLSTSDKIIYLTVKDIIRINEINKIPRPTISKTDSLYEAVKGKNYYLALKIISENSSVISDNYLRKEVTILLVDINQLIRKVVEDYKQRQKNNSLIVETNSETQNNGVSRKKTKK